jgi:outer membrane protein FlgP
MHNRLQLTLISGLASLSLVGCAGIPVTVSTPAPATPSAEAAKAEAAEAEKLRPSSSGLVQSMIERRQSMTATGYAVISVQNHRLPAQQRLLAIRASKLDAYRALTEQVYGQYLDATTTVADMVVQSDSFRARVEGVIYGATLVSITPVGDDTYETTLSLDSSVVDDIRSLYLKQLASARVR